MSTNITFHPGTYIHRTQGGTQLTPPQGAVSQDERSEFLGQKGATIWLTGLSASGKVGSILDDDVELIRD
jgi:hypothetical protein